MGELRHTQILGNSAKAGVEVKHRLYTVAVFSACIAAFFVTMATVKASDEAAEAECKAMVREAMWGLW